MSLVLSRRHVLRGLIAAPAVVAAANIMPIKALLLPTREVLTADKIIFVTSGEERFRIDSDGVLWLNRKWSDGSRERPFRQIHQAMEYVTKNLDLNGKSVTIQVGAGNYERC